MPRKLLLALEGLTLAIQNRADLIHQRKIMEFFPQLFQIPMPISQRHLLSKGLAEVEEKIREVIIWIAPVYVSKIDCRDHRIIDGQTVVSTEVGMEHHGLERKNFRRFQIHLKMVCGRGG